MVDYRMLREEQRGLQGKDDFFLNKGRFIRELFRIEVERNRYSGARCDVVII